MRVLFTGLPKEVPLILGTSPQTCRSEEACESDGQPSAKSISWVAKQGSEEVCLIVRVSPLGLKSFTSSLFRLSLFRSKRRLRSSHVTWLFEVELARPTPAGCAAVFPAYDARRLQSGCVDVWVCGLRVAPPQRHRSMFLVIVFCK